MKNKDWDFEKTPLQTVRFSYGDSNRELGFNLLNFTLGNRMLYAIKKAYGNET